MTKTLRLAALLSVIIFLYGCELALIGVGAGLGAGTYRYMEGNLERDYPLAYDLAWNATNIALGNRHISISSSINEGVKGTIEAVRKDGKKIIIKLRDLGQDVTSINVRVGFFGSRNDAEIIHEEIRTVAGLK